MKWINASDRLPEKAKDISSDPGIIFRKTSRTNTFVCHTSIRSFSFMGNNLDEWEWLDETDDSEAVEFHEWVGKQGYKLSHYAAQGEAIHLHESAGSTPFHELREGDWLTTSELYDLFKQSK